VYFYRQVNSYVGKFQNTDFLQHLHVYCLGGRLYKITRTCTLPFASTVWLCVGCRVISVSMNWLKLSVHLTLANSWNNLHLSLVNSCYNLWPYIQHTIKEKLKGIIILKYKNLDMNTLKLLQAPIYSNMIKCAWYAAKLIISHEVFT